ncbi:MAG TPA: endolytic transglycosylase MltG [Prolixibacteraceae bacterium]|nr:endolytic transglycosylase MltG [Prolixibacteraceae bacterium]
MELKNKGRIMLFPRLNKYIAIIAVIALCVAGLRGFQLYNYIFDANIYTPGSIIIPPNASYDQVIDSLKKHQIIINYKAFNWVAKRKKYPDSIKPGKYLLDKGLNTNEIVNMLRSGNQHPVMVTFNNLRFLEELAGAVSKYIQPDSLELIGKFTDPAVHEKFGFNKNTFHCMFIPNSYEFYWTTTAEQFMERMSMEYKRFWNEERLNKAKEMGLTPEEVMTVASIVQEESNKRDEKPVIAGLYLNRIKRGIPLQADPTVKFALGNFRIKRVLKSHLAVDSPYNTYRNPGLPPGPINFPENGSIDAVLNAAKTPYIYMCAREDFSGYHNFSTTLAGHLENARKYKAALDSLEIFE